MVMSLALGEMDFRWLGLMVIWDDRWPAVAKKPELLYFNVTGDNQQPPSDGRIKFDNGWMAVGKGEMTRMALERRPVLFPWTVMPADGDGRGRTKEDAIDQGVLGRARTHSDG